MSPYICIATVGFYWRERGNLGNLIFVINCNLQRLDGPVRGNGKIIQELAGIFQGAKWNVIKVIWGGKWDSLLEHPDAALLVQRMSEEPDGTFQKYSVESGAYIRKHFFGKYPELLEMVKHLTDDDLTKLNRGGHDPNKMYAAYKTAVDNKDTPSVILAHSVKGYGMGETMQGRNVTHQQKTSTLPFFVNKNNYLDINSPNKTISKFFSKYI